MRRVTGTPTISFMKSSIVIVSGGMDSVTLLHHLHSKGEAVIGLSIDYGQRHRKELTFAKEQCDIIGVEHVLADASGWGKIIPSSSLTGDILVPEGHYAEESMKQTVVPNRNMLLLSFAVSLAVSRGAGKVAYGAHSGDHAIYPDCREDFYKAMASAIALCDYGPPKLIAPFVTLSKADIVKIGLTLGVDYSKTWTCYKGEEVACGKCGTCVERLEAFALNGAYDPLPYLDQDSWKAIVS